MDQNKKHAANTNDANHSEEDKLIQPSANDASSLEHVISHVKETLITSLSSHISELMETCQNKLFDMSNIADNNEEQARYFELMNQIRVLKSDISQTFIKNLKSNFIPATEATNNKENQDSDFGELQLVDQDDLEGTILVKGVSERATARHQEQLSQLEARLNYLIEKTTKAFKADAVFPTTICQAFDDALAKEFDVPNKKTLFSMFDAEIANNLGDVYKQINDYLIEANILQTIDSSTSYTQPAQVSHINISKHSISDDDSESDHEQSVSGENISGFAMTAPLGVNSASDNKQDTPEVAPASYYGRRASDQPAEYQHQTAGIPAKHVAQVLDNYLGSSINTLKANLDGNSNDSESGSVSGTTQHFNLDEVQAALSKIQNLPQHTQPTNQSFDSDAIKQAIVSEIAKSSGGVVTKSISKSVEKTIDFIELIFDAIIDDSEITDTIKTLLLRLQIPIIKASMLDPEFFIYDDHPAREFLDTVADVGVGINDHDDETYAFLDKTITTLLNETELDTEKFENALSALKAHIEDKEAIARAREEEEQRQLLRKHARATILKSLRAATVGKILPESTHPLILKRWPTLMFNHYLKNGKENNEWITIVFTLRRIVDSVQPIESAEHFARLQNEKDELLQLAEKLLNTAKKSKQDVQDIINSYKETLEEHLEKASFTQKEVVEAEKTVEDSNQENTDKIKETTLEEENTITQEIPANIMPGMWFQVYMGEDKAPRRCKLSVILIEDASLMFVNHMGELIVEKTFDEFNEEVASEKTFVIMGHSVFENAFKTVINRIE